MSKFQVAAEVDLVEVWIERVSQSPSDLSALITLLNDHFYAGEIKYDDTGMSFLCYPDQVEEVHAIVDQFNEAAEEPEDE